MTTLTSAIRQKLEDRQLSATEIDSLLNTADGRRNDGIDASEMRAILRAIDETDHGLSPALRAQLASAAWERKPMSSRRIASW
ncbi:MAG: hypothetical protein AAFY60_19360, partial [Myxococcota bacterium]